LIPSVQASNQGFEARISSVVHKLFVFFLDRRRRAWPHSLMEDGFALAGNEVMGVPGSLAGRALALLRTDLLWELAVGVPAASLASLGDDGVASLEMAGAACARTGFEIAQARRDLPLIPTAIPPEAADATFRSLRREIDLARDDALAAEAELDDGGLALAPSGAPEWVLSPEERRGALLPWLGRPLAIDLPSRSLLVLANKPAALAYRVEAESFARDEAEEAAEEALETGFLALARSDADAVGFLGSGGGIEFCRIRGPVSAEIRLRALAAFATGGPGRRYMRRSARELLASEVRQAFDFLPFGRVARDSEGRSCWRYSTAEAASLPHALERFSGTGPAFACARLTLTGPFFRGEAPFCLAVRVSESGGLARAARFLGVTERSA
jgi:hypothetical protein